MRWTPSTVDSTTDGSSRSVSTRDALLGATTTVEVVAEVTGGAGAAAAAVPGEGGGDLAPGPGPDPAPGQGLVEEGAGTIQETKVAETIPGDEIGLHQGAEADRR